MFDDFFDACFDVYLDVFRGLGAIIVVPTRELAFQVRNHIQDVARASDLHAIAIVGGMSQQKQKRILKKRPEIVVATPGRLWDLIEKVCVRFFYM